MAAGDIDEHALGALHRGIVQQRVGNSRFGGIQGAAFAFRFTGAHHSLAHFAHHRVDVGEIQVDQARHHHQVGNAANARIEHIVGHLEGIGEGGLFIGDPEQVLVGNNDQGIDELFQFLDTAFGDAHAVGAFELKRLGNDADGQNTVILGRLSDDRGRSGAGTATHSGGDEHHVRTVHLFD